MIYVVLLPRALCKANYLACMACLHIHCSICKLRRFKGQRTEFLGLIINFQIMLHVLYKT